MPKQISKTKITAAIIQALDYSQDEYENWTGGDWLWTAPEYLLTTNIAKHLYAIDGAKYITLENNVKCALDDAGACGKGKLKDLLRSNGRCDVLLWWGDGSPRAIIEVKNQVHCFSTCKSDIDRIVTALSNKKGDHTIQFGVFAFYTSARNLETVNDRLIKLKTSITEHVEKPLRVSFIKGELHDCGDDGAWASTCVLID
ncbi:MAG: hypothetical protein OCC45_08135 [Desulfotalea sp.]